MAEGVNLYRFYTKIEQEEKFRSYWPDEKRKKT